jgi:cell division protein FtsI/penicillin-binding protein 2
MKIKNWEDLYNAENKKYIIKKSNNYGFAIYTMPYDDFTEWVAYINPFKLKSETAIEMLKALGFDVKFIKSPLEQVKEELKKIYTEGCGEYHDAKINTYDQGYFCCKFEMAKELLNFIERVEEDENSI